VILTRKIITKQEGREVVFVTEASCRSHTVSRWEWCVTKLLNKLWGQLSHTNISFASRNSISTSATINRHDFGLGQGAAVRLAAGSMVVIEVDLEAVQQTVEVQEAVATAE